MEGINVSYFASRNMVSCESQYIRDVAYAAATVNNAPFRHYQGSLLCISQKLRIIFFPRCHNKSFDDVTAELGPFSLLRPVAGQRMKIHEKKLKKLRLQFFRTNDQANKENMLGEKKIWGLVALNIQSVGS